MLVVAILGIWILAIGIRLVHLQVVQAGWLKERATTQRRDIKKSKMPRGTIFDRNGRVLALSMSVKTLYADAVNLEDIELAARTIAKLSGQKASDIRKTLIDGKQSERRFVPLVRGLDEEAVQKYNAALEQIGVQKADMPKFPGLHWREEQRRKYPQNELAAHIIGFSDADGIGRAGIEQSQNDLLYGTVIRRTELRDRLGRVYDEQVSEKEPPKDVFLTIQDSIQYKTESALAKAVQSSGARAGIAIVLDHKTGEILAMANYPTFDPNNLKTINSDNLMNRAVQSVYSPGSVFKLITYGTALEKRLISPDAIIDSGNGTIEVAGHRFRDSHAIGTVTYTKALAHSSNVCAIKTGLRIGKDNFYQSLQNFGFGKRTGIELPAETPGIVRPPSRWNGDSLASMSIGYEIGVTALQMTTAFATIANDGVRVKPHIIKEIRQVDENSGLGPEVESEQVLSPSAARALRQMLREVVISGTGKRARANGYDVAGKTGTAWKYDEKLRRVNSAKYMSSFIGFAPADNPAVTVAVIIDEPKIGGRDGGQVAAPAFREIIEQILPELNVRPDFETDARLADNVNNNEDIPEATAPDSAGESADFQEIPAEDKQPSATEKLKIDKRTPEAKELPSKATNKEKPRNNSNSAGPKIEKKETGSRPLQPTRDRIVNKPPGNISEVKGKT
jgi:cell division protein FtsI/penicillin-binding protein 2